jgi:hypothetical protein
MFFELQVKFLAEIVGNTENFGNFILGKHIVLLFIILLIINYKDNKKKTIMLALLSEIYHSLIQNSGL